MISQLSAPTPAISHRQDSLFPHRIAIVLSCVCAVVGVFAFYNTARWLLEIWRTDDLKSVGLLVPFLSFLLVLRAWRSIGWEMDGTWWGFAILACTAGLVFLRDQTTLVLTVHRDWLVQLPPVPLLAILYAAGMVLLFGGTPLLRAAAFPVLLMGAVLPVPETFSSRVDVPLQHASATVARGFAHLLGEPLTPDRLRLMFTPEFGMFIAPGCNGIRGAVTLGLAALVIAHVYRFRRGLFLPLVLAAVVLGYLFNFLRLCLLVVYYKIALPYPWLQVRAKGADYLIGGGLFVLALWIFFAVADRLRRPPPPIPWQARRAGSTSQPVVPLLGKVLAVCFLAAVFGLDDLHGQQQAGNRRLTIPAMPEALGHYHRLRTYEDTLATGVVVYTWGDYASADSRTTVSVGVSPELDVHDVEVCHLARGEDPRWHGQITATTPAGAATFVAAMYNDGLAQTLEASTLCDAVGCRQYTSATANMTFVYAHPRRVLPLGTTSLRSVPMLLKVRSKDVGAPAAIVEAQLATELEGFLRQANLEQLAAEFRGAAPRP